MSKHLIPFFTLILLITLFISSPSYSATSYTAASCAHDDIQSAVDSCMADNNCNKVFIPEGDCTWTIKDDIDIEGNISIIGAGQDKTIIRSAIPQTFFDHDYILNDTPLVEYTGFSIIVSHSEKTSSAINFYRVEGTFRIHHIYLEGRFHGMIGGKQIKKGLIDHCKFVRPYGNSTYGITFGSDYLNKPAICDLQGGEPGCESTWNNWYTSQIYCNPSLYRVN